MCMVPCRRDGYFMVYAFLRGIERCRRVVRKAIINVA